MMGTGVGNGANRAREAAEASIANPLLDENSMRGAKGVLVSISGSMDMTLYEVDEAATRIREEVDAEANIILGATFDDALEGTMRVSVVATGLAIESETLGDDSHEEEEAPARPVFGYTGRQPIPVKKPIPPTPVVAAPQMAPARRAAPAPQPERAARPRFAGARRLSARPRTPEKARQRQERWRAPETPARAPRWRAARRPSSPPHRAARARLRRQAAVSATPQPARAPARRPRAVRPPRGA